MTGILYRSKNMANIERQLQFYLNKIQDWADNKSFKFSKSKTTGVHFCQKSKHRNDPDLKLNRSPIKIVKEFKFLRVIFDSQLSFVPHIKMLKTKCAKALDILKVVSNTQWGADKNFYSNFCHRMVARRQYSTRVLKFIPVYYINYTRRLIIQSIFGTQHMDQWTERDLHNILPVPHYHLFQPLLSKANLTAVLFLDNFYFRSRQLLL
jgi:hypothetical protein